MKHVIIALIKVWRAVISPWYGPTCKYYPSCSAYALDAVQVHGAIKGTGLIIWRLLRCNPWSNGGVDPVPGSALAAQIAAEEADENGTTPRPYAAAPSPAAARPHAQTRPESARVVNVPSLALSARCSGWFHHPSNEVCPC